MFHLEIRIPTRLAKRKHTQYTRVCLKTVFGREFKLHRRRHCPVFAEETEYHSARFVDVLDGL
jgi:hypothetical protein